MLFTYIGSFVILLLAIPCVIMAWYTPDDRIFRYISIAAIIVLISISGFITYSGYVDQVEGPIYHDVGTIVDHYRTGGKSSENILVIQTDKLKDTFAVDETFFDYYHTGDKIGIFYGKNMKGRLIIKELD